VLNCEAHAKFVIGIRQNVDRQTSNAQLGSPHMAGLRAKRSDLRRTKISGNLSQERASGRISLGNGSFRSLAIPCNLQLVALGFRLGSLSVRGTDLGAVSYLDRYPLLRSRDSEFARDRLFSAYGADRFGKQGHEFGIQANFARLNSIGLAFCAYDGAASLSFPESQILRQFFSIQGAAGFRTKGNSRPLEAWSPIISGDARLDLDFAPGYRQLVLRIDVPAISRLLNSLLGDDCGMTLRFASGDADPAVMTQMRHDVFRFAEELERFGQDYSPIAIAELERALMVRILLAHRHNFSDRLQRSAPRTNRSVVDIVESYIEAHWDEPLDLQVIAEVANVSLRTVFREFAESGRGSPGQFARRVRLHRAAELLRRPDAQTSVLAVAFKCGFRNLGRFASEYRQAIGELPSETLKNSRRRQ